MRQKELFEGVGYIHYLDNGNGFTNCALNICRLYVNYTPIKKGWLRLTARKVKTQNKV